jgi:hypothetical protein
MHSRAHRTFARVVVNPGSMAAPGVVPKLLSRE